jgi:hypothetical protein
MPILTFFFVLFIETQLYAWDGYDWANSSSVQIDKGELVREGESVEFYDYGSSEYRSIDIDSIETTGDNVEITGIDSETGEQRTFEME